MCWFITIGIAPKGAAAFEALAHRRVGLGLRPSGNPFVAALFAKDDIRLELTHGGCSCDLVPEGRDEDRPNLKKMRRRHEAQGWSEAKIVRAIQAAENAHSKSLQKRQTSAPKLLFRDTVIEQVRRFGSVRLFAHFYSGSQDDEQVTCLGHRRVDVEHFGEDDYPKGVLVEVIASGATEQAVAANPPQGNRSNINELFVRRARR
jgi:hypothetical protein